MDAPDELVAGMAGGGWSGEGVDDLGGVEPRPARLRYPWDDPPNYGEFFRLQTLMRNPNTGMCFLLVCG